MSKEGKWEIRMIYNFLLATGNIHKLVEFTSLFNKNIINLELSPKNLDIVESGETFQENALLKARGYFEEFKKPTLADDSGLVVEALPGELGIYSARYGGEGLSDEERVDLLLTSMKGSFRRSCYFICILCFCLKPDEIFFFEGRLQGNIAEEKRGEDGFGYDSIFIPLKSDGDKTLAELPEWKCLNSHRSKASKEAESFFQFN